MSAFKNKVHFLAGSHTEPSRGVTVSRGSKLAIYLVVMVFVIQSTFAQSFTSGFSFYLPPQDTTGSIFLPRFPMRVIADDELNTVDADGHFSIKGKPVRFFGTNFVADGAFPTKSKAWFIAGRLRNMGFNLVRFHHLDNPWSTQSIFEWGKDTRHLNPTTLDRLENLIAELKKNGIYVNMNLHVSRTFRAQDAVPDYDSLPEFSKAVNYFDPLHQSLHKEYAKQLLTHVNPYTGKSLVNDPVMALVEITNENSLYRFWRDGALKHRLQGGQLSMRHTMMLDSLWLDFLKKKYVTTLTLQTAWNSGIIDRESSNQIRNGGFESGIASQWVIEKSGTAQAVTYNDIANPYKGNISAKITVQQSDGTDWHLQFKQTGLTIHKDSSYTVTFAARSDSSRTISVSVLKETSPWTWYGGGSFMLTTGWKEYSLSFKSSATMLSDIRLSFALGAQAGSYWFDEVTMKQPSTTGLLADESFEANNIRRIEYGESSSFSDQRVRDIASFYLQLETDFYASMKSYLKDSLGVNVPIVGTNWNVGAADLSAQSTMDYIDNHAYWDHPSFPSVPWSSTDWLINNTPMVTSLNGGTIAGLMAGVPVVKKPYTISEYNHPFPNRYQSEGVLFLSAYSSFHDVDGIMYFDYNGSVDDWESDRQSSFFNIDRNTALMALMPSCAYAYRNGLISRYQELIEIQFTKDFLSLASKNDDGSWLGAELYPRHLSLMHGIRVALYNAESTTNFASLPAASSSPFTSDTKELVWNSGGMFSAVTGKFIGITGLLNSFSNYQAGQLTVQSADKFGTLTWISLTDDSLCKSHRSLLTLSSRIQNTNMVWDGTRTIHDKWGTSPTLVEPVTASLLLTIFADSIYLYPLDASGNATGLKQVFYPVSPNLFFITLDQNNMKTVWFGIEAFGQGIANVGMNSIQEPREFFLSQNYPNPFNPTTRISYSVPEHSHVRITLANILGSEIETLVNEQKSAGQYSVIMDASHLASGIYFYTLQAGNFSQTKKCIVLR